METKVSSKKILFELLGIYIGKNENLDFQAELKIIKEMLFTPL